MIFRITFKIPDIIYNRVKELVREDEYELEKKLSKFLNKYIKWGKNITVEFDSEKETATVLKLR